MIDTLLITWIRSEPLFKSEARSDIQWSFGIISEIIEKWYVVVIESQQVAIIITMAGDNINLRNILHVILLLQCISLPPACNAQGKKDAFDSTYFITFYLHHPVYLKRIWWKIRGK